MLDVAQVIYETGKTYLIQQGKFLAILFVFIGAAVAFYFGFLSEHEVVNDATGYYHGKSFGIGGVLMILGWTVIGILGSYSVAWFGIRMNTLGQLKDGFCFT